MWILSVLSGCNGSENAIMSCSFHEEHFNGSSVMSIESGKKVAQKLIVTRSAALTSLTLEMDLLTSSLVNFYLLEGQSGVENPVGAKTLVHKVLISNSTMNPGKITFSFSRIQISPDKEYFIVLKPGGGDIELSVQSDSPDILGELWVFNGLWNSVTSSDLSFSVSGNCE